MREKFYWQWMDICEKGELSAIHLNNIFMEFNYILQNLTMGSSFHN